MHDIVLKDILETTTLTPDTPMYIRLGAVDAGDPRPPWCPVPGLGIFITKGWTTNRKFIHPVLSAWLTP